MVVLLFLVDDSSTCGQVNEEATGIPTVWGQDMDCEGTLCFFAVSYEF